MIMLLKVILHACFQEYLPFILKVYRQRDTVLNTVCENRLNDRAIAKGRKTAHYVSNNILAFYANTLHNRVKCLVDGSLKYFSKFQIYYLGFYYTQNLRSISVY